MTTNTSSSSRSVRFLLGAIAVLLAANLLVMINPMRSSTAQVARGGAGGIPDSGAQLQAQIDQLTELNKKVDKLDSFLESGGLTVKIKDDKASK
jgi:hypothetical protein